MRFTIATLTSVGASTLRGVYSPPSYYQPEEEEVTYYSPIEDSYEPVEDSYAIAAYDDGSNWGALSQWHGWLSSEVGHLFDHPGLFTDVALLTAVAFDYYDVASGTKFFFPAALVYLIGNQFLASSVVPLYENPIIYGYVAYAFLWPTFKKEVAPKIWSWIKSIFGAAEELAEEAETGTTAAPEAAASTTAAPTTAAPAAA